METLVFEDRQDLGHAVRGQRKALDERSQGGQSRHRGAKFSPQAVVLSTPASRQGLEYLFSPLAQASDPLKSPLRTELGWHQKGQWGLSQPGRAPMDNRGSPHKPMQLLKINDL